MILVNFNENNTPAFYNPDINSIIPETAREISEEVYNDFLNNQGVKIINPDTLQTELIPIIPINPNIETLLNMWSQFPQCVQNSFNLHVSTIQNMLVSGNKTDALQYLNDAMLYICPLNLQAGLKSIITFIQDNF